MRILLMNIQIAVLLVMAGLTAAAGSGLAGLTALTAGSGPAALGGVLYLFGLAAVSLIGLVAFVIPISTVSALSLLFAILAGWRYLRWCRFLGVLSNLGGMAWFIALHLTELLPGAFLWLLLPLNVVSIILFLFLPRRPSLRLTRIAAAAAQLLLYMMPVALCAFIASRPSSKLSPSDCKVIAVILLIYALPFVYNWRAVSAAMTPNRKLVWKLAISTAITALILLVVFPMGIPLALGTLLLFELAEMALLYPSVPPPSGSAAEWIARVLGRLPEGAVTRPLFRAGDGEDGTVAGDVWEWTKKSWTRLAKTAEGALQPTPPDPAPDEGETASEAPVDEKPADLS